MGKMNHLVCLLVIDMEYFLATMPCAWKLFFSFGGVVRRLDY
jgi:hypothetical protein